MSKWVVSLGNEGMREGRKEEGRLERHNLKITLLSYIENENIVV